MASPLTQAKYTRDRQEVLRILKYHLAIIEESKHTDLGEALVEQSVQFSTRMIKEILALGEPEPGQERKHINEMLLLLMRLHREEMERADG